MPLRSGSPEGSEQLSGTSPTGARPKSVEPGRSMDAKEAPDTFEPPEMLRVGRVLKAHGIRGEVKVEIESDVPGRFRRGSRLLLVSGGEKPKPVRIASCRSQGPLALVFFEGVADRNQAETLRGASLMVSIDSVPEAPDGLYYYHQLLGCRCEDEQAGELGRVKDLIEDGGGLLLLVEGKQGSLPIPFVDAYLKDVDVASGQILLRLPEGLIEACASKS